MNASFLGSLTALSLAGATVGCVSTTPRAVPYGTSAIALHYADDLDIHAPTVLERAGLATFESAASSTFEHGRGEADQHLSRGVSTLRLPDGSALSVESVALPDGTAVLFFKASDPAVQTRATELVLNAYVDAGATPNPPR